MNKLSSEVTTLANGVQMPWVGLGTWDQGPTVSTAIEAALRAGYRSIDTGSFYQNEPEIGSALKKSGVSRESLFITTKVWNSEQGYEATLKSFAVSLERLQLDYVDLYLIHWPVQGKSRNTWRALEKVYQQGKSRAIGVSNFGIHHLKELKKEASLLPMANQIDLHPFKRAVELHKYCASEGIQVVAWAPLAQGKIFGNLVLEEIAQAYHKTVSQIVLRWHYQNGVVTIPKSNNEQRIIENISIFDFELSEDDLRKIDALDQNHHLLGFEADDLPAFLLDPPAQPWPHSL